jgi:hypothetical protein
MPSDLIDWGVLDRYPESQRVARQCADRAAFTYDLDPEDLYQEALILIATQADLYTCFDNDEPGLAAYRLDQDLYNGFIETNLRRRNRNTSLDASIEEGAVIERGHQGPDLDPFEGDYNEKMIATLLPAVWDDAMCYGMKAEDVPDPDMPRGFTNKARSNALWAYIGDIRQAWKHSGLSDKERRALLLYYGLGWTMQEIAHHESVTKMAVSKRINKGVSTLGAYLNG